jgi:1,4-alpha-glucan branching enzyme
MATAVAALRLQHGNSSSSTTVAATAAAWQQQTFNRTKRAGRCRAGVLVTYELHSSSSAEVATTTAIISISTGCDKQVLYVKLFC